LWWWAVLILNALWGDWHCRRHEVLADRCCNWCYSRRVHQQLIMSVGVCTYK
jgi:hypothetical protein